MYVKVLYHARNRAAVLYTTDDQQPLDYGRHRIERDPTTLKVEELFEEIRVGADSWDTTCIRSNPTAYRGTDNPYWEVSWVRFRKPGQVEVHLVASTTPVYLLDQSGKTIDRI